MAIEHPWTQPPAPGTALAVAPGVAWLRMPLPFQLDHINLWLLDDGDGWAIVDTGVGLDDVRALWEQVFTRHLGGRPVTRVILTHFHPDHIGNAGLFASSTWVVDPDERTFAFRDAARANAQQFAVYSALETSKTATVEAPTYDVFGDGSVIVHQAPGHTPGHTILQVNLKEAGPVLLTGDLWHIAESRAAKRVPRFNTDRAQTLKSYEMTEALAAKTKARVVRQHVPEDFAALPKFPEPLR